MKGKPKPPTDRELLEAARRAHNRLKKRPNANAALIKAVETMKKEYERRVTA